MSEIAARIPQLKTDIIMVDFVGFSTLDDAGQYVAVSVVSRVLVSVLDKLAHDSFGKKMNMAIGWVPTGDGFYVILNPLASGAGLFAALGLRHVLMTRINRTVGIKGVRFAVHHGPCMPFDDVTGKRNYIGSGLNDCAASSPSSRTRSRRARPSTATTTSSPSPRWRSTTSSPPTRGRRSRASSTSTAGGSRPRHLLVDKHGKSHRFYFADVRRDEANLLRIPPIVNPIRPAEAAAAGF